MKPFDNKFSLRMDNLKMNKIEVISIIIFLVSSLTYYPHYKSKILWSIIIISFINIDKLIDSLSDGVIN